METTTPFMSTWLNQDSPSGASVVLFVFLSVLMQPILPAAGQDVVPPPYQHRIPEQLKEQVHYLAGSSAFSAARARGVTEIMGKSLDGDHPASPTSSLLQAVPVDGADVSIGDDPVAEENGSTVVVNPANPQNLVAGSHFIVEGAFPPIRCVAYFSNDGGATWSGPISMPHLTAESVCSDPVLAYAPDGSRVYYAYMDIKETFQEDPFVFTIDYDIVVSYSDDGGATWTGPVVALGGDPTIFTADEEILGFLYDKCWIGTHVPAAGTGGNSNWVYVTATRFDNFDPFASHIAFARSDDRGASWGSPVLLQTAPDVELVQGPRPTGGLNGDVLVAWYYSGTDGWLTGSFHIQTAYSSDHGATFDPTVSAVEDDFELPFWLGPFFEYHRWWSAMYPDVEIAPDGTGHITYTHDPVELTETAEDGDVRYLSSTGPPYTGWTAPLTLNDDGLERAQGYAALETQHEGSALKLNVLWEDHRLSETDNLFYDIFYTGKIPAEGPDWFPNLRLSDASSISDFIFIGDNFDLAANEEILFGVWTDRRHQNDISAPEDNIVGSPIFQVADDTPPTCEIVERVRSSHIIVRAQDPQSGLASIEVLKANNASVAVPAFGPGATEPVLVRADKIDKSQSSVVALAVTDVAGNTTVCDPIVATVTAEVPEAFRLEQNYPNPFNPTTTIRFAVAEPAHVTLAIYDVLGRKVATLVDQAMEPGTYAAEWDGTSDAGQAVVGGTYLYRLTAGTFTQTKTMTLLK